MSKELYIEATDLLKKLIAIPSFSREEDKTADAIEKFLKEKGVSTHRYLNNVWAVNKNYNAAKPCLLLNSHHDTVKPNKGYRRDPFAAEEKENKLFGLGSNDAGGSLVSLIATFLHFNERADLPFNIIIAATAEEEISGNHGVEALLLEKEFAAALGDAASGIVGEPTQMQMAVAERGLLVLDCIAEGRAGHAAREEGENAIYKAMKDVDWFRTYAFPKVSGLLGPVKMSVTSIETENKAHNITPPQCAFVVDVRVNELYTFEEVIDTIQQHVQSKVQPRSTRLRSSSIAVDHPLVRSGLALGRSYYGSPTTSDKALMPFPTLKMGPGDSARSHIADEFIFLKEIEEGIGLYIRLVEKMMDFHL